MKTLKIMGQIGAGAILTAVALPQAFAADVVDGSTTIHRISHQLASDVDYTRAAATSGYKWGKTEPASSNPSSWADGTTQNHAGYKWDQPTQSKPAASGDYAGSAGYQWKVMNKPEQTGYRWRTSNTPEVTGYRWRASNTPAVTGYRWRASSTPEVTGYRWRASNTPAVTGYRWRASNTPTVAGYRWRASNTPTVAGYRWRAH
jgi:opacity protein-like surface antigen